MQIRTIAENFNSEGGTDISFENDSYVLAHEKNGRVI